MAFRSQKEILMNQKAAAEFAKLARPESAENELSEEDLQAVVGGIGTRDLKRWAGKLLALVDDGGSDDGGGNATIGVRG